VAAQPALHLPIFTAGEIHANIKAKKAHFDAAVYAYNQLVLRSAQEVADLLALAKSVFYQKKEQEKIVDYAKARYKLTELRREKGLDDRLTDDIFHEELIQKKLVDVTLLYDQYLAVIKLIKALGGGYHSEHIPLEARS
jgi:outer membrane protein TolC